MPPARFPLNCIFTAGLAVPFLLLLPGCLPGRSVSPSPPPAPDATHGVNYRDVATEAGISFRWSETPHRPLRTLDAFGCGCAIFDFDADGLQDILLIDEPRCALFRNVDGKRFEDVTERTGLAGMQGAWKACAVGDVDGDGRLDLVLSGYRRLALLRNQGGRFADATAAAGLDPANHKQWGSGAGFMDLDRDGDLDLVVLNYVVWGPGVMEYCNYGGIKMGCPPKVYDPEKGRLYRNDGNGRFTDVSKAASLDTTTGVGLVVGFSDADEDGLVDFYLGNDAVEADFMKNLGGLKFRNVALENGTIYSKSGKPMAAMGVDWADFDRDGRLDFAVTDFSNASFALFKNAGEGMFQDIAGPIGMAAPTFAPLGFGVKFVDADNDGWSDIFFVNGHVYDRVQETDPKLTFRQPSMLFRNEGGKRVTDLVPLLGGDLAKPILGRGSASGDWDNDGRMDLLAVDYEGSPLLLHNESTTNHHWLKLILKGKGPNTFAYGARVTVETQGEQWNAEMSPASSYLSSSDPRLHFGLGILDRVDRVRVQWPSGKRETFEGIKVDAITTLTEGSGKA